MRTLKEGEEQNREQGEMAQKRLGVGRNRGEKEGGGRKSEVTIREEGEIGSKIREKGDLLPCSSPLSSL